MFVERKKEIDRSQNELFRYHNGGDLRQFNEKEFFQIGASVGLEYLAVYPLDTLISKFFFIVTFPLWFLFVVQNL